MKMQTRQSGVILKDILTKWHEKMRHITNIPIGPDDMPAHIKASLLGSSVSVPITNGKLLMGTWQGVYLCEHRDHASGRTLTITVMGA
jgi:secondary thiamine-phosphate synthase enzyme